MQFDMISEEYIDEALKLVLNAYTEEREMIEYLPNVDYSTILKEKIQNLFKTGLGIVALVNGTVIGFLVGYEIEEFWGKCKGIYCPLYGHGAVKENRHIIYQQLYEKAAKIWVEKDIMQHAITLYAQDAIALNTWFRLGFGMRCVDGIREVASINDQKPKVTIKKAEMKDIVSLEIIDKKHNQYYRSSPLFMPVKEQNSVKELTQWLNQKNHHLWIAYSGDQIIGYMRIEPTGESYITSYKDIMNITGAYVDPVHRGKGIGETLLNSIQKWLAKNNYSLCGVDYESFNISGSRFWEKYFTPYTYSLVRRIDERIID
jgi:GNAT superfamily N-acetyltransferase